MNETHRKGRRGAKKQRRRAERRVGIVEPMPEARVDEELRVMGVDPEALAKRGLEFVAKVKRELGK